MERPYLIYGKNVSDAARKAGFTEEQVANIGNLTRTFKSQNLTVVDFATQYSDSEEVEFGKVYYIVMDKPVKNTRSKPYKVEHLSAKGKRSYKLMYQVVDSSGMVYDSKATKQEAIVVAKEVCKEQQRDISVKVVKEVTSGDSIAAEVKYTPSKNMRDGSYFFFSITPEVTEESIAVESIETVNESL